MLKKIYIKCNCETASSKLMWIVIISRIPHTYIYLNPNQHTTLLYVHVKLDDDDFMIVISLHHIYKKIYNNVIVFVCLLAEKLLTQGKSNIYVTNKRQATIYLYSHWNRYRQRKKKSCVCYIYAWMIMQGTSFLMHHFQDTFVH